MSRYVRSGDGQPVTNPRKELDGISIDGWPHQYLDVIHRPDRKPTSIDAAIEVTIIFDEQNAFASFACEGHCGFI